jgi:uncharacterized membrane protein
MAEDIKAILTEALEDAKLGAAAETRLIALCEALDKAAYNPYRLIVHFLVGLIGFCLALMVAIFSTLHNFPAGSCNPAYRMLGGVLVWISIAALVATMCAVIAQLCRHHYRCSENGKNAELLKTKLFALMVLPVLLGAIAVGYCILGGAAILNQQAVLPGWWDAIHQLWLF